MSNNYTIMHIHSMLSNGTTNIDSITNFRLYVQKAKELGMRALCFTEHGNIFEWVHKKEEIEKAGMKYIHGVEAYVTESTEEKIRDNYHCILIAKNYEGVLELNRLVSKSYDRNDGHFYYMPRITFDELERTSNSIIVSTACLGGILNRGNELIKNRFICFLQKNKERCYLEIQHHCDQAGEQKRYNQYLYELSKIIDVPLITGTDTHALNDEHLEGRSILQKAKKVRFADEESWDLTFKSYEELVNAYKKQQSLPIDVVLDAIENTNRLADMIEPFELDRSYKYPHLWGDNSLQIFMDKIEAGIKKRGVDKYPNYQEYRERIRYEMDAYIHNQAIDFMLLMEDIIDWCRKHDILVGYGRGSVNGSVIAWLLGITEMDSIKHRLNFDRFMNVERVSLSDIDTDFPPSRIEEVKQYIFSKQGLYCCDIVTFNTVADKGAIRDVGRALEIPLEEVANICDSVDDEEKYEASRKKYKNLFKYVDLIKGTIVSVGSHPCGLVVAAHSIDDRFGTFTTSTSNYPISLINMKEIDSLNYVKLDLLRLDTIELINDTCKLAGIQRLTPDNVDITDIKVWNAIRDDTTQIFQWEGTTGDSYIKKLLSDGNIEKYKAVNEHVDRMTLLSIGNSAIRPAGASYREDLANGVVRKSGSKSIDDFLSNTFGYLVFQEQIISFLHLYCGFTMGEADVVRRHFAKKYGTENDIPIIKYGGYLDENKRDHYIAGYITTMQENYGQTKEEAEKSISDFLQVIIDASNYLFSLNHSQPYSYEGYVSGYLRTYYPLEFLTTALNINRDKEEKTRALTIYAKKQGIKILLPKFRHSRAGYFCDKDNNAIYKGVGSLKYMNNQVADELFEMRDRNFEDFIDVLYALEQISLNSRQLEILIKIDFFAEFGDINMLMAIYEKFIMLKSKLSIKKDALDGIPEEWVRMFSEKETVTRIEEIDVDAYLKSKNLSSDVLDDCVKYKYVLDEKTGIKSKIKNGISFVKLFKKFDLSEEEKIEFATKTVIGKFEKIDTERLLKHILKNSKIDGCSLAQRLKYQLEFLGYIDFIDEKMEPRMIAVLSLDTSYSPKFQAYCLQNGKVCDMKVHARLNYKNEKVRASFADSPFENGDVLYMISCSKEPKKRKNDSGQWESVPNEFNWWLNDYKKVVNL